MVELTIIDLSSIFWQTWHATGDQEVGKAFDWTVEKIYKHVKGQEPVAIAVDSPPYKRKEIYPEYKAQRDKPSEVALGQLRRVIERLEDDGFPIMRADGYEADDVIATIVARTAERATIVSSDKDLLQIVTEYVTAISPLTGESFTPEGVWKKFGVYPKQLGELLVLTGDRSDNVPGVPGVGHKIAAKIINEEHVTDAIRERLDEYAEQIETARRLVRLMDDAPIDVDRCFQPRIPKHKDDQKNQPIVEIDAEPVAEAQPLSAQIESATTTQIVPRQSWALALEPTNSTAAWKLANLLFNSRLYTKFTNPESILAVMLRGRALGFDATTALDGFHVIEGQPALSAPLKVGLVISSPACDYFKCIESTTEKATYITHRSDDPDPEPTRYTFTWEMAVTAELTRKTKKGNTTNWHKRPETMLRWRCATELCNMVYPDIVSGVYTPDELSDGQHVDAEVL